ncbi:aspartic peptidase domain-containing protein [Mycena amicta]|nr:aspartic peptidase domain-containing protein [Mycena amicta]
MLPLLALCLLSDVIGGQAASPATIQLQGRVAPHAATLRRRAQNPVTVNLTDYFLGTDLQWFGNLSIGTPLQNTLTVVFDTGSSSLEVASTLCGSACSNQAQFDPSNSSTFIDIGDGGTITFATGIGVDPVVGNNYQIALEGVSDTVAIGDLILEDAFFYLIKNQTAGFSLDPFSGIQGAFLHRLHTFTAHSSGSTVLFSMYLTPLSVGGAELTIGGIDTTKFRGDLIYAALPANTGPLWTLDSPQIFVNGKTSSTLTTKLNVIFDSGTSNVYAPVSSKPSTRLSAPTSSHTPLNPAPTAFPARVSPTCPQRISVAFTAQDGQPFNLTIPSSELSVGPFEDDSSVCQTLINAFDGLSVLGGSLLKHYYSVWDIENQRMGFAAL